MSNKDTTSPSLPDLDDMLHSLLLVEEGEHEFNSDDEDIQELRQLFFPVTRHTIYFNHASTGPLPAPVARTLHEYTDDASNFGNIHATRWNEYYQGAHRRLANLLHARADQIAFTASTGDSLMLIAQCLDWQPGDTIVVAEGEFPCNVYSWLNLQELGVQIEIVPARERRIAVDDVLAHITARTRLVSLSLVGFSTGFRTDIRTIAAYCRERAILCGVDAMQAIGAIDVDVQQLGVDFVASAIHKWLLAPHTSGFLYMTDELLAQLKPRRRGWFSVEQPMDFFNYQQQLKAGAARFEHSSANELPIVGMDAALGIFECIDGGMQAVEQRILGLTDYAIAGLERMGYPVISPQGEGERSGIICFQPHPERQDLNAQLIADTLLTHNIFVSAREGAVRVSPHFYNVHAEIDTLLNLLEDLKLPPVEPEA
jgi:cysteine desulfurase / selenocysteine lyase